jgi:hypothetical protein
MRLCEEARSKHLSSLCLGQKKRKKIISWLETNIQKQQKNGEKILKND